MLGMNQIKKKMLIGFGLGLLIGVVVAGVAITYSVVTVKGYREGTSKEFIEKYQQEVSCFTREVRQGEKINDDMVDNVRVHINNVPENIESGSIVGQVAKYNIPKNIPIVKGMITEQLIAKDLRQVESNVLLMPSDAVEGDIVDIRLMYPNGTDFVVATEIQINKINETTSYFDVTEEELLLLDSAIVDSFLYTGTKLYAVRYVEPDSQIVFGEDNVVNEIRAEIYDEESELKEYTGEEYVDKIWEMFEDYGQVVYSRKGEMTVNYQPNVQVQELMKTRPNIIDEATERLEEDVRNLVENQNSGFASEYEDIFGQITSGMTQSITTQKDLRAKLLQEAEQAEQAEQSGQSVEATEDVAAE